MRVRIRLQRKTLPDRYGQAYGHQQKKKSRELGCRVQNLEFAKMSESPPVVSSETLPWKNSCLRPCEFVQPSVQHFKKHGLYCSTDYRGHAGFHVFCAYFAHFAQLASHKILHNIQIPLLLIKQNRQLITCSRS